ncbi:hypothetical protein HK101_003960 [Irineochytrium annulatum]|nr:hypothetical protein HK101_003960 [Irineochytrium annulatum]
MQGCNNLNTAVAIDAGSFCINYVDANNFLAIQPTFYFDSIKSYTSCPGATAVFKQPVVANPAPSVTPSANPVTPAPSPAPGATPVIPAPGAPPVIPAPGVDVPGATALTIAVTINGTSMMSVIPASTAVPGTTLAMTNPGNLPNNPPAPGDSGASAFVTITQTVIGASNAGATPGSNMAPAASSSSSFSIGVIVAIVIGACVLTAIIVAVCILMTRASRRAKTSKDPRLMGVVVGPVEPSPPSYASPAVVNAAATPAVPFTSPPSVKPNPNTRDFKNAAAVPMEKAGGAPAFAAPQTTPSPTLFSAAGGTSAHGRGGGHGGGGSPHISVFPNPEKVPSTQTHNAPAAGSYFSTISSDAAYASHPKITAERELSAPPRGVASGGAGNAVGGRAITIMGEGLPAYDEDMAMGRRVETAEERAERAEALLQRLAEGRTEDQRRLRELEERVRGNNSLLH